MLSVSSWFGSSNSAPTGMRRIANTVGESLKTATPYGAAIVGGGFLAHKVGQAVATRCDAFCKEAEKPVPTGFVVDGGNVLRKLSDERGSVPQKQFSLMQTDKGFSVVANKEGEVVEGMEVRGNEIVQKTSVSRIVQAIAEHPDATARTCAVVGAATVAGIVYKVKNRA